MPGPNADTVEDDGYLLGLVYNAAKHKSFLAVSLTSSYKHNSTIQTSQAAISCINTSNITHALCCELGVMHMSNASFLHTRNA